MSFQSQPDLQSQPPKSLFDQPNEKNQPQQSNSASLPSPSLSSQCSQSDLSSSSPLYFHSILCNPHILDNPSNTTHCFMQDIFRNKKIKRVKRTHDFLLIDMMEREGKKGDDVMEKYSFRDAEIQKELKSTHASLSVHLKNNKQVEEQLIKGEEEFHQWVDKVKDNCIICWYIPDCGQGPKLRSFSISKSFIKMVDYDIDELALDIQSLGAQAIDVIDGQIYKAAFLMFVNAVRKFKEMRTNGGMTQSDILKQSQLKVINQVKGRGNKKLTVETKTFMASQSVICFQVLRVLDKKEQKDFQRKLNRESAISQSEKATFSSLSRVLKLPKTIDPSNESKICGYIVIKNNRYPKQSKKQPYL